jgi:hypothetical protein
LLTLYTGDRPVQYARSPASGSYTFTQVPFGLYGVTIFPPDGYVLPESVIGGPSTSARQNMQLTAEGLAPLSFKLLRSGSGAILVETRSPTGAPVAGIQVTLYGNDGIIKRDLTAASGRVAFANVPIGVYGVSVSRPRGLYDYKEDPNFAIDKQVIESGTLDTLRVTLTPCQGTVRARVRDDSGSAVAGIAALLYAGDGFSMRGVTDDAGVATFDGVGCGEYGLVLAPRLGYQVLPTRGHGFVDAIPVSRAAPLAAPALSIARDNCSSAIRARVVDNAGLAVQSAQVKLYTAAGDFRQAVTDAAGNVNFDQLPCTGEFGVMVQPAQGYTVVNGRGTSFFDAIRPGGPDLVFRVTRS